MKKPIIFCLYCVIFTLISVSFCFAQEEGVLPGDYSGYDDTNGSGYADNGSGYDANGSGYAANGSGYDANGSGYAANGSGYDANGSGYAANAAASAVEAAGSAANAAASAVEAAGSAANAAASEAAAADYAAVAGATASSPAAIYAPQPPPQTHLPPPPVRNGAPTVTFVFPQGAPPAASVPPAPRQAINVIPAMPNPYSNGVYRVQVGAFSNTGLAQRCFNQVRSAGFEPFYEQNNNGPYGVMYRVVLVGVRAADMAWVVQRLEAAGFSEIWLREER